MKSDTTLCVQGLKKLEFQLACQENLHFMDSQNDDTSLFKLCMHNVIKLYRYGELECRKFVSQ